MTFVALADRRYRNDDEVLCGSETLRLVVKLGEVHAVAHHLVAGSGASLASLELDDEDRPRREQHAVDSETAAAEVVLQDDVLNLLGRLGRERLSQELNLSRARAGETPFQHLDALRPLLVLLLLDVPACSRCRVGQRGDDGEIAQERLPRRRVPGDAGVLPHQPFFHRS